jgi:hypothetical protein
MHGGLVMNLKFTPGGAAEMLRLTADAKCCLRLVRTDIEMATLRLVVTVDGKEVMFSDSEITLNLDDNIEIPNVTIDLRVS